MDTVAITSEGLTPDEVLAVVAGARVTLSDGAVAAMTSARAVLDDLVVGGAAMYGVTTGVGHERDVAVPREAQVAMQEMLLESHRGGLGPPLSEARVRAAMVVRLGGFALGGSGVSPHVAEALAALLNNDIHPIVPDAGSVGSGDLAQLAFVGRVLLGRGEVTVDGAITDATTALAKAGIEAVQLGPKDGLAIMSANAVAFGHATLLLDRLLAVLALADLAAACTMEALRGNPSIVEEVVAVVRGSDGQRTAAAAVRDALAGSVRTDADSAALSVQDPLSMRVVPQVHGAARDVVASMRAALEAELTAPSDNPLVDADGHRVVSNGNFHPMGLALAVEGVRLALAHVGLLTTHRTGRAWDAAITALGTSAEQPASGTGAPGGPPASAHPNSPTLLSGLGLRYPAAARSTRLRQLATPITLDVPPLDLGVEDHSTNLAVALDELAEAVGLTEELLVVEVLNALAALVVDGALDEPLGAGTGPALHAVAAALGALPPGARPDQALGAARRTLAGTIDG